jgi:predicted MPP superfamily phosphohydrolase
MRSLSAFLLFLAVFLTLYGLMHFYFYWKLTHAFPLGPVAKALSALALLFLVAGPILVHLWERAGVDTAMEATAFIAYVWMGALFLFIAAHLVLDAAEGVRFLGSKTLFPGLSKVTLSGPLSFLTSCFVAGGITIFGAVEAGRIGTETICLPTGKLPPHMDSFRVVQISDLHLSVINGEGLASKVADVVKGLHPDLLVSTGDFIDRGLRDPDRVSAIFRELAAPYGKFAVTGNHEFYMGLREALAFTRAAGFTMLRNEWTTVAGAVNLVGVDDPASRQYGRFAKHSEEELLRAVPWGNLTLLLKHQPRVDKKSLGRFDLQLSGHTHDGQIFPFALVIRLIFPFHRGLYTLPGGAHLYVSRGTGTWGPPIRFLSPPEVTVFEFRRVGR